jgi:acetoin utilization protein AcuB
MKVGRKLDKMKLVVVSPDDGLELAFQLMVSNRIRHLLVVDKKHLVGILSDRDLKAALILSRTGDKGPDVFFIPPGVMVREVMTRDPITISPDTDVEEAARIMYHNKIGGLPVLERGRLLGIITESDILSIFIEIMGVIESSSRVDVEMDDAPDSMDRAAEVIRTAGGRIISVAMSSPRPKGRRTYYFRLSSCDTIPIEASLKKAGFRVVAAMS